MKQLVLIAIVVQASLGYPQWIQLDNVASSLNGANPWIQQTQWSQANPWVQQQQWQQQQQGFGSFGQQGWGEQQGREQEGLQRYPPEWQGLQQQLQWQSSLPLQQLQREAYEIQRLGELGALVNNGRLPSGKYGLQEWGEVGWSEPASDGEVIGTLGGQLQGLPGRQGPFRGRENQIQPNFGRWQGLGVNWGQSNQISSGPSQEGQGLGLFQVGRPGWSFHHHRPLHFKPVGFRPHRHPRPFPHDRPFNVTSVSVATGPQVQIQVEKPPVNGTATSDAAVGEHAVVGVSEHEPAVDSVLETTTEATPAKLPATVIEAVASEIS